MAIQIKETETSKQVRSKNYNYDFNKINGSFARWGSTFKEDPQSAPSPEILDIEISTKCHGINNKPCTFCYKSNNPCGDYMTFETFKKIFKTFPRTLTQVAFGIGSVSEEKYYKKIKK